MTSSSMASEGRRGLETQHVTRLADVRHAELDVVLERRVGDVRNGAAVGPRTFRLIVSASSRTVVDFARSNRLKSLFTAPGRLHRQPDSLGQVAAVCVVADLIPVSQDVQRILAFEYLLNKVRNDMAHGQGDVAGFYFLVAERLFSPVPTQLKGRRMV